MATLAVVLPLASVACATEAGAEDPAAGGDEAAALTNATISLKYEGTCNFLRECSRWSRGYPEGYVLWGCNAENTTQDDDGSMRGPCDDDDLWVAGPYKSSCGQIAHICKGSVCIDAKVKDISVSHSWEASNGVMNALGLSYKLLGACSGAGGGSVKITTRHAS